MTLYSLVPCRRKSHGVATRRGEWEYPFWALRQQTNRLFEDFFNGFGMEPFGGDGKFNPDMNVTEDDKNVYVSAELAGMDTEDIELSLSDNVLTIKGEKKGEKEHKDKGYHHIERSYGTFERILNLPAEVDEVKAEAKFEKGVLKIALPKKALEERKAKRIAIKGS